MKKIIVLVVGLVLLAILGKVAYDKIQGNGKSDNNVLVYEMNIQDTAKVDKIIITESSGRSIEVLREGKNWIDSKGNCVQKAMASNILDAAYNIQLKGYVPENAIKPVLGKLASLATKVMFYKNGDWSKTWFLGTNTADHLGTYVLVETAESGKSEVPIIAELKNMSGILNPRFSADPKQWMCQELFSYKIHEIKEINVTHNEEVNESFSIKEVNKNYSLQLAGKSVSNVNQAAIVQYLVNYKKISWSAQNYDFTPRQVDSIRTSKPFCKLEIKGLKSTNVYKLYRANNINPESTAPYDGNSLWCLCPNGDLVKCQYFVFNKLIYGSVYFAGMK